MKCDEPLDQLAVHDEVPTLSAFREHQPRRVPEFRVELIQGIREIYEKDKSIPWDKMFQWLSRKPDFTITKESWRNVRTNMVRGGKFDPSPNAGVDRCLEILYWLKYGGQTGSRKGEKRNFLADDLLLQFCDYFHQSGDDNNTRQILTESETNRIDNLLLALGFEYTNKHRSRGFLAERADHIGRSSIEMDPWNWHRFFSELMSGAEPNQLTSVRLKREISELIMRLPTGVVSKEERRAIKSGQILNSNNPVEDFDRQLKSILVKDMDIFNTPEIRMNYLRMLIEVGPYITEPTAIDKCREFFSLQLLGGLFFSFNFEELPGEIDVVRYFEFLARNELVDIWVDVKERKKLYSLSALGSDLLAKGEAIYDEETSPF